MKLTKTEKLLIATMNLNDYELFDCDIHKMYLMKKPSDDTTCLYCSRESKNITEFAISMKENFREELQLDKY
jgi:hypothetical protein